jgi:predicted acyltransferase
MDRLQTCRAPGFWQSRRMPADSVRTAAPTPRITSIDALRGFVMFMMIFVNDLAGAPRTVVPDWMVHFSDRHKHGSGMTFVDLVFPAFLFLVGMSIPFALGGRLNKGEPVWKVFGHVAARALALLAIGILMVNGESAAEGNAAWSPELWAYTLFLSAIFAFSTVAPRAAAQRPAKQFWTIVNRLLRAAGFAGMIYCAFAFQGNHDQHIITLSPFSINPEWYGILGIIGWSYLFAAIAFLAFRNHHTALFGCLALLLCLYPAERTGFFDGFWLDKIFGIGEIGAHTSIAVAGVLLASVLVTADTAPVRRRVRFALLSAAGFAAAAVLLNGLYGISKNSATPSWCLWSCAITTALWLMFYLSTDVQPLKFMATPLSLAGQNVLLAYLLSEMLPSPFGFIHFDNPPGLAWYVFRCLAWAGLLLWLTVRLNRLGFRLKL